MGTCSFGRETFWSLGDKGGVFFTPENKVADLSPKDMFGNKAATDGTKLDLNIGETRVWRL